MPEQAVDTPPPGSVIITPKEMYDEIVRTHEGVQRMELLLTPQVQNLKTDVERLNARVRVLERWRWLVIGTAAGGGLGGGYGLAQLVGG